MDWFGHSLEFWGMDRWALSWGRSCSGGVAGRSWPVGSPGSVDRDRQPGMMLLISMAITVAYAASMATTFGWLDLEFWWELATLVTIMLLEHWQEAKAVGRARGALAALAELLPDAAERSATTGRSRQSRWPTCSSAMWSWCARGRGCRPTA